MTTKTTTACGIIPSGKLIGTLPTVLLACSSCDCETTHEDQGLRSTCVVCLSTHFMTLDELSAVDYPRSK